MHLLTQIGLVALGSALGGVLRWGVGVGFARWCGTGFPWGTAFINITGCLFLGWLSTVLKERLDGAGWLSSDNLRLLLAVGFTGGYTTFSTFEFEANTHLSEGDVLKTMTYIFGSVFLGLLAVRLGIQLAQQSLRR